MTSLRAWIFAAAIFAAVGLPVSGRTADCCDGVVSCAAAVATGGLSCAGDAAKAAQEVLNAVTQLRDYARGRLATVLNYFDQQIKQRADAERNRVANYRATLSDAMSAAAETQWTRKLAAAGVQRGAAPVVDARMQANAAGAPARTNSTAMPSLMRPISANPGKAVATQIAMADANAVRAATGAARARLADLNQRAAALFPGHDAQLRDAVAQSAAIAGEIGRQFDVIYVAKLTGLMGTLSAGMADPVTLVTSLAAYIAQVESMTQGLEAALSPLVGRAITDINARMGKADATADAIERMTNQAIAVSDALRHVELFPVQENLNRLQEALAASDPSRPSAKKSWVSVRPLNPAALVMGPCDVKSLARDMSAFSSNRFSALQPRLQSAQQKRAAPVPSYAPVVSGEMDRLFTGKPPADGQKALQQMIQEARQRYAADPRTVAAVERYLRDEAGARGVR